MKRFFRYSLGISFVLVAAPLTFAQSMSTTQPQGFSSSKPAASMPIRGDRKEKSIPSKPSMIRVEDRAAKKQADLFFSLGRYGEALEIYQSLYKQHEEPPVLLLKIAGCQERIGDKKNIEAAKSNYQKFLVARPNSPIRPKVQERLNYLEKNRLLLETRGDDELLKTPVYKKWWFWTGLIAVTTAVVVGIVLSATQDSSIPSQQSALKNPGGAALFSF